MKILVVEDGSHFRWRFRIALEAEGFEVLEASSFQAAIDILSHEVIDAVIASDTPTIDGANLAETIRRRLSSRDMVFLLVTRHPIVGPVGVTGRRRVSYCTPDPAPAVGLLRERLASDQHGKE